jgi:FHS family L-fucose permease-like MFS transporter
MRILYVFVGGLFLLAAALFYFQKNYLTEKRILLLNPQVKDEDFNCYYGNFDSCICLYFSRYEDQSLSFLENNEKTT